MPLTSAPDQPDRWVFAHGFTQSHHSWLPTIAQLERLRHDRAPLSRSPDLYTAIDLPGHGLSAPPHQTGLDAAAQRLRAIGGPGTYVGYSLGGRLALTAAVQESGLGRAERHRYIRRLVLISSTAGLEDPDDQQQRRDADAQLAARIAPLGVPEFLDEWLALPLFDGAPHTDRTARERNTTDGLAASLRCHGTGAMMPLWDRLGELSIPVLIVTGERDQKFTRIGRELKQRIPHATHRTIDDVGHAILLQAPQKLATLLYEWVSKAAAEV